MPILEIEVSPRDFSMPYVRMALVSITVPTFASGCEKVRLRMGIQRAYLPPLRLTGTLVWSP